MSVQIEAISSWFVKLQTLNQQMTELLALRRAVCRLDARRGRPKVSRRPIYPASHMSAARWAGGRVGYRPR
jgi:hypothetical protein